ncbi:uncharacterized protein GGS22DRAFT_120802 [Annulohypoxylon maeteangense]|uniref:uncharacterized protein n=1 Tax=Annulohypoxylon maeteangense TaxID=1927788 RepID=UPI002007CA50|nr:uncharacterized protein GGS22DRAFT_120802 [Annulohypoxylon maeteangense]KAI0887042.1 hypothetical protein GGS22DRAFT_120802 [Annulohypoxylon maeteangense]
MDVVGSAAALAQLIAQVIELWQQINMARESVKSAPKVFEDTKTEAHSLFDIIQTVKRRPELHIAEIHARVERINSIALELHKILEVMALRQRKSVLRQGLYALVRAERDDAKLNNVLKRLDMAKGDLILQIGVVNVGIAGELRDTLMSQVPEPSNRLFLERNESWGNANQINGVIGIEDSKISTTACVLDNKAFGDSQQKNLILAGSGLLKLLEV